MSLFSTRTTNNASAAAGSAVATPYSLVQRDANGADAFTSVTLTATPTQSTDAATKGYTDSAIGNIGQFQGAFNSATQYKKSDSVRFNQNAVAISEQFFPNSSTSFGTNTGNAPGYEVGTEISVSINCQITALRHYHYGTIPSAGFVVHLWNAASGGALLATATLAPASITGNGWYTLPITAVAATAGSHYIVSFEPGTDSAGHNFIEDTGALQSFTTTSHITFVTGWYNGTAGLNPYTANPSVQNFWGNDVVVQSIANSYPTADLYAATALPTLGVVPTSDAAWEKMVTGFDDNGAAFNAMPAYSQYDHVTTFTGPVTTASRTLKLSRIGRMVQMYLTANTIATSTATAYFTSATPLPAAWIPTTIGNQVIPIVQGSTWSVGKVVVDTLGNIVIYSTPDAGTFASGASAGFSVFSMTWTV